MLLEWLPCQARSQALHTYPSKDAASLGHAFKA